MLEKSSELYYIWATIVAFKGPFDILAIIFYVFAILYFVTTLFPFIMAFIPKKKEKEDKVEESKTVKPVVYIKEEPQITPEEYWREYSEGHHRNYYSLDSEHGNYRIDDEKGKI